MDPKTGLFTIGLPRLALPRSDESRLDPETGLYEPDAKPGLCDDNDMMSNISDGSFDAMLRDMFDEKIIDSATSSTIGNGSNAGSAIDRDAPGKRTTEMETKTKTAKPERFRRLWTTEGLEGLATFIIADEKRVLTNLRTKEFDAAISGGLYIDVSAEKHADEIKTAVHDVFNEKVVGYNNDLWFKTMVSRQAQSRRLLSKLSTEACTQKEKFKAKAKPRTADFAVELVQQMAKNWYDAMDQRNEFIMGLARVEGEVREKNKSAWISFLQAVKEGEDDALFDAERETDQ